MIIIFRTFSRNAESLSTNKIPIVVASLVVYAFDRRRFDFRDPNTTSSIPKEGSSSKMKIPQLLTEKYPILLEAHRLGSTRKFKEFAIIMVAHIKVL